MRLKLKQFLSKLVNTPMIIEQGTEGVWTWRKWSNGTAECWGKINEGSITWSSLWTYSYYSGQITRQLPTGLFLNTPLITSSAESNAGLNYITIITATTSNTQFTYYITSSKAETRTCYTHFYMIGNWAELSEDGNTLNFLQYGQAQMTKAEIQALIENSGNQFKDNDTWTPSDLD